LVAGASACTCLKKARFSKSTLIKARLWAYAGFLIGQMMNEIGPRRKQKRFRAKWTPVRLKKTRQNKRLKARF
jgi:hypothetical protein